MSPSVHQELNFAIFRAAVTLFDRLKLEPSDGTTGEDVAHAVSRLFIRYASFLIKTWDLTRFDGNVSDSAFHKRGSRKLRFFFIGTR